jgi:hypothetical protein
MILDKVLRARLSSSVVLQSSVSHDLMMTFLASFLLALGYRFSIPFPNNLYILNHTAYFS